ncbi:MAG: sigma-70 family RNA polymerase sigma factor [Bacteroidales bacterium]|jgi:RNA polymerase sigma-70 factor (ECF subfamily)|nr:sigma-70 family RNA polymerase sigma factor [Bacteroidales bacterium]
MSVKIINKEEKISMLIEECKQGKSKSQQLLYQKFAPILMAICLRFTRNETDAEDLLQEAFIRIFISLRDFKGKGSFEGWLKRITINCAINQYKKKERIKQTMEIEPLDENIEVTVDAEAPVPYEILLQMVHKLPAGYRTIFNLSAIDGYSHEEIAEMIGVSYSNVASQLFRAKKSLQKAVQEYLNCE